MANRSSKSGFKFTAPQTGSSSSLQLRWAIEPLPRGSEGEKACSATTYLTIFSGNPQRALKLYMLPVDDLGAEDPTGHPKMTYEVKIYKLLYDLVVVSKRFEHAFLPKPCVERVPMWAEGRIEEIMKRSPRVITGNRFYEKCLDWRYLPTTQTLLELYTAPDFKTKFSRQARANWLTRLLEILLECHAQGIAHGNFQTRHVLIDVDRRVPLLESVKILDWSSAVVKREVLPSEWEAAAGRDAQAMYNLNIIISEDGQSGGPDRHVIPENRWWNECVLLKEPMDLTPWGGMSDAELEAMGNRLFGSS